MTIPDTITGLVQHEEESRTREARTVQQLYVTLERLKARWNDTHARAVKMGGGEYVPGMLGDLVLFNSPATGSTLALHEADLTPEAVRQHIAESNAKFGVQS